MYIMSTDTRTDKFCSLTKYREDYVHLGDRSDRTVG